MLPPTWEVVFANRKKLTEMMKVSSGLLYSLVERKVIRSKHRQLIEVSVAFISFIYQHYHHHRDGHATRINREIHKYTVATKMNRIYIYKAEHCSSYSIPKQQSIAETVCL